MKSNKLVAPDLASKGGYTPERLPTQPMMWQLEDGHHLTAECSFSLDDAPACPSCLAQSLKRRIELGWIKP